MTPVRLLFVCTHNGARSRIAEAFAEHTASQRVVPCSASLESERIGPLPIAVMGEIGIELSAAPPKSVFDRYKDQERFDYVVTMCDPAGGEQAPIFLADVDALYDESAQRVNWIIPSFRSLTGTDEEKRTGARLIRDRIRTEVAALLLQLRLDADRG